MEKFREWCGSFVVVGKTVDNAFHDLSRHGVFRLRTEHELFCRQLCGESLQNLPAANAKASAKANAKGKAAPKQVSKRKARLDEAVAVILRGEKKQAQPALPIEDGECDDDVEPEVPEESEPEFVPLLLQCHKCKTHRVVDKAVHGFYQKQLHSFECKVAGDQCRKISRKA